MTISIYHADNLKILQEVPKGTVTLVYLDPPFFSGRDYFFGEEKAFSDRWGSFEKYLESVQSRILAVQPLLSDAGSMVLHVDPKTSHYLKVICDEIFGMECFASEVIWRYRRWPTKTPNFQRVHDVMLRYVKDPKKACFNQLYEPASESTQKTWGTRKQKAVVKDGVRVKSVSTTEESPGVPLGDVWDLGSEAAIDVTKNRLQAAGVLHRVLVDQR